MRTSFQYPSWQLKTIQRPLGYHAGVSQSSA